MSKYIFNFAIRFLFFWIVSIAVMQKTLHQAIFFSLFMAAGFMIFDWFFGATGDPKKQDKNIIRILAGQELRTKKEVSAWIFINLLTLVGGFLIITEVLYLFVGQALWMLGVAAVGSFLLCAGTVQGVRYYIKRSRMRQD